MNLRQGQRKFFDQRGVAMICSLRQAQSLVDIDDFKIAPAEKLFVTDLFDVLDACVDRVFIPVTYKRKDILLYQ